MHKKKETPDRIMKIIPNGGDEFLVYFPLKKTIFQTNEQGVKYLQRFADKQSIDDDEFENIIHNNDLFSTENIPQTTVQKNAQPLPTAVTLLPTFDCNLRCVYCYADGGKRRSYMSLELGKSAVNFITANALFTGSNSIRITFHGGGEPTCHWELLREITKYADILSNAAGLKVHYSIGTNGVMSSRCREWIIEHINGICLSLDGPQDIHDAQRPLINGQGSYNHVIETIKHFEEANISYHLRTTVTPRLLPRLFEFYDLARKIAPKSSVLQLEPMFPIGRALLSHQKPPEEREFLNQYLLLSKRAETTGYPITFAACDTEKIRDIYCGAYGMNFVLTPEGHITTCYETSTTDDFRWDSLNVGKYDYTLNRFVYYLDRIINLRNLAKSHVNACSGCVAHYHCAGDCLAKRYVFERDGMQNPRCSIIQLIVKEQIKRKTEILQKTI